MDIRTKVIFNNHYQLPALSCFQHTDFGATLSTPAFSVALLSITFTYYLNDSAVTASLNT